LAGYKGYVTIVEGTSVNSFEARNGQQMPLGFDVLCEKFHVEKYANGAPKEFRSTLTVLENGKPVPGYSQVKVIVNEPLTYKGITFYQSSYGQASEGGEHFITVTPRSGGATEKITAREGVSVTLKDGTMLKFLEATPEVREFAPGFSGPAARIEVTPKGAAPNTFIVFKDFPEVNAQRGDALIFGYEGSSAKQYTGLQVAKDPGVWVVWLGCTLMVLGIFIAFFMSHKRVWVVVSKGHARLYGNASKNQAAFQMHFEELSEKFKEIKI
jgi:cytochrome c biogenesis protein